MKLLLTERSGGASLSKREPFAISVSVDIKPSLSRYEDKAPSYV